MDLTVAHALLTRYVRASRTCLILRHVFRLSSRYCRPSLLHRQLYLSQARTFIGRTSELLRAAVRIINDDPWEAANTRV